jgi:hypothetical protein
MPLLLTHQKSKKTKKNLSTYISQHHQTRQDYHHTQFSKQHHSTSFPNSKPPPFGWHLQHPICIFIFNTHFASSSSIPILHLHLQHPFGIILKHPILYHQPVWYYASITQISNNSNNNITMPWFNQSSTPVTPMVDEICSSFQRFLFLVEYESFFLS